MIKMQKMDKTVAKKKLQAEKTSLCVVASAHCTLHFLDFIDRRVKVVCLRRIF